jgi:hypothetical protein
MVAIRRKNGTGRLQAPAGGSTTRGVTAALYHPAGRPGCRIQEACVSTATGKKAALADAIRTSLKKKGWHFAEPALVSWLGTLLVVLRQQ